VSRANPAPQADSAYEYRQSSAHIYLSTKAIHPTKRDPSPVQWFSIVNPIPYGSVSLRKGHSSLLATRCTLVFGAPRDRKFT
jgi:hypothetical protein